jgi:uncharacterized protein DUF4340
VVEATVSRARGRRRLLAVWVVLGLLVAVIVAVEYGDHVRARSRAIADADDRKLVPVPVEQLGAVEIADAGRLHRFARDASGAWFYHGVHTGAESAHTHTSDPAVAARIEKALAAFGRTRMERDFPLGKDGATYGLTTPDIVIVLYRDAESQPLVQYAVGQVAPDTLSRYVMVVGRPTVVTIPNYQIDNLRALVHAVSGASEQASGPSRP